MKERWLLERLEQHSPAEYINQIRASGRKDLPADIRDDMAELYEEVLPLLRKDTLSPRAARVLRLAEPILQSEWKLRGGPEPNGGIFAISLEKPGKRYLAYTNMRVLNA